MPGTDCGRWPFTICRNTFIRLISHRRGRLEVLEEDADAMRLFRARRHVQETLIAHARDMGLATKRVAKDDRTEVPPEVCAR